MEELKNPIVESKEEYLPEGTYRLPVGYRASNGELHRTITLKPMTGETEEAMADPKIRDNGGKLVTELIFNVTESLGSLARVNKDIIRNLTIADRDFILVKNKIVSSGNSNAHLVQNCPHCRAVNDISADLDSLQVEYLGDDGSLEMTFELPIGVKNRAGQVCKKITIHMPTGAVQERIAPIAKVNPAQATTAMLSMITVKLEGVEFLDATVFKSMTKRDRDFISKKMEEFGAGIDMAVDVTCSECGQDFTAPILLNALLGE